MNYSKMSDFEINRRVAELIGGFIEEDIFEKEQTIFKHHGCGKYSFFDPCNSWADAGPIIEKHRITIAYDGEEKSDHPCAWVNVSSIDNIHAIKYQHTEKTLRAAMIVFLMMQGKPDAT